MIVAVDPAVVVREAVEVEVGRERSSPTATRRRPVEILGVDLFAIGSSPGIRDSKRCADLVALRAISVVRRSLDARHEIVHLEHFDVGAELPGCCVKSEYMSSMPG